MLVALQGRGEDNGETSARRGVEAFNAAYAVWDGAGFGKASDWFRQAISNAPGTALFQYWLGVSEFHRMLQLQNSPDSRAQRTQAEEAREAALAAVLSAVKLDERHGESHALVATLYGMKIDGNWFRAAQWGPRLQEHRKRAMATGSENPRVMYLLGTCQFHTARRAAGQREALASLLRAEELFVAEAAREPGPLDPRWGHSSCLTFIGQTYEKLGQRPEAADYYQKALARHPADHVAREGLARVAPKPEG